MSELRPHNRRHTPQQFPQFYRGQMRHSRPFNRSHRVLPATDRKLRGNIELRRLYGTFVRYSSRHGSLAVGEACSWW